MPILRALASDKSSTGAAGWGLAVLRIGLGLGMILGHGWPKLMAFSERAAKQVMGCRELFAALFNHGFASLDNLRQIAVIVERAREVEISDGEIRLLLDCATKL